MPNKTTSKIIGITFLAIILLNFPIIGLFGKKTFLFGIPLLYLYIFIVWFLLITALGLFFFKKKE